MLSDIIPISEIEKAQSVIKPYVLRTPLVRLNIDSEAEIFLKLENLQPVGSFKLRGACNAMAAFSSDQIEQGVYTASAGNMAQGLGYMAKRFNSPCTILVPEHIPNAKLEGITRLGAAHIKLPFDQIWEVMKTSAYSGCEGTFVHPFCQKEVVTGNATVGLEILEDLKGVDEVIVPFGGGGLATGIGSVFRQLSPVTRISVSEVETVAPVKGSLESGCRVVVPYIASFVDGIGASEISPAMWDLVQRTVDGSHVSGLEEIASAVRLLMERNRVVAEGAGASSVAAALRQKDQKKRIVCVVSGGCIDTNRLVTILNGEVPR